MIPVEVFYILLGVCGSLAAISAVVFLVYLFILVRPKGRLPDDKSLLCDYAHRGLHGGGVPENSLEAFELACRAGYGIELDIQLSKDGEVMVFHDGTLNRMTGVDKDLCELTAAELSELRLAGTEYKIPTLREVLALVDGRVPLLVELKGGTLDTTLCGKAYEILKDYKGSFCLESFNPWLVKGIKELMPDRFCGLLYSNMVRDKKRAGKKVTALDRIVSAMALTFVCKPNFIAYNEEDRNSFPVRLTTRFYKTPKFIWTVTSKAAVDRAHALGECPIFEKIDRE